MEEIDRIQEILPAVIPPADRHPARVYLARLAPGSRVVMAGAVATVAELLAGGRHDVETFPWTQIGYQHAQALRAAVAERYAPSTANRLLSALRGVLKEAWRLGYISAEELQRSSDIEPVSGSRLPAGRALKPQELRSLFTAEVEGLTDVRNRAMLAIAYGCGLRRAEIVALDIAHFDAVDGSLRVIGKGNKERRVYVGNATPLLNAWIALRGTLDGPLFPRLIKGGKIVHGASSRLTGHAVRLVLEELAKESGIDKFSPHDLRRTFIGDLLDAGADLVTVQGMAGHANVQTTARYDRRGDQAKKRAAYLLNIPGV